MLTETEQLKALAAQLVKLLRSQKDKCLMMADLLAEYAKTFGYPLRLQDYDVGSVPALLQKVCHVIKVGFQMPRGEKPPRGWPSWGRWVGCAREDPNHVGTPGLSNSEYLVKFSF